MNIRYSDDAIAQHVPTQLINNEGEKNIWYSGELYSHDDIASIMQFNSYIARLITRGNDTA
jgi:hypothetical protein